MKASEQPPLTCRTAALAPHCDDLAFSLGGVLWDGSFGPFLPITVFSRSNYTAPLSCQDSEWITALRKTEDRRFFSRLPTALPPVWLDRMDAPLRLAIDAGQTRSACIGEEDEEEVEQIATAVEGLLPPPSLLLAPLALGGHIDHRLVRLAACLLQARGYRVLFYEDTPYAGDLAGEEIEDAARLTGLLLKTALEPLLFASPAVLEARLWAVQCYASQCQGEDELQRLLRHARRLQSGGLPAERLWRPVQDPSSLES
jgi:LmbE family N-acetylglucosaminyl deacetylase